MSRKDRRAIPETHVHPHGLGRELDVEPAMLETIQPVVSFPEPPVGRRRATELDFRPSGGQHSSQEPRQNTQNVRAAQVGENCPHLLQGKNSNVCADDTWSFEMSWPIIEIRFVNWILLLLNYLLHQVLDIARHARDTGLSLLTLLTGARCAPVGVGALVVSGMLLEVSRTV